MRRHTDATASLALAVAAVGMVALAGCDSVTSENIEKWKTTVKGPANLEEALKNPAVPASLRAQAAAAMGDTGKAETAEAIIAAMNTAERSALLSHLVPFYIAALDSPVVEKVRDARDGLFAARAWASADQLPKIEDAVLGSIAKDLKAGRPGGGRHSADTILGAIGPRAAPTVAKLLADPAVAYTTLVEIVAQFGNAATKDEAANALIKRAAARPIPVPLWRALGTLGGKTASGFLRRAVEQGTDRDPFLAAQALRMHPEPEILPLALRIAADTKASRNLREEMFGICDKLNGPSAWPGILHIISTDPQDMVRYRAFQSLLANNDQREIQAGLEAFPAKAAYKRPDMKDFLVNEIAKTGPPSPREAMLKTLRSKSPLARLAAVMTLEFVGSAADVPAILKLSGDKGTVKGLGGNATVGKEAVRVAAVLKVKR